MSPKYLLNNKITIKIKFKIIGVADAAANLLYEFNIAPKNEDKLTNNKKGKVILVKLVANSIFFHRLQILVLLD